MYVIGGLTADNNDINLVDVYDADAREWRHDLRKVLTDQAFTKHNEMNTNSGVLKYRLIVRK